MIVETDIDLTEMDYVMRQLTLIGDFDKNELPPIMRETALDFEQEVEIYPQRLPNQRYIRTGTYADSVFSKTQRISNGIMITAGSRGAVHNGNRYDPYLKDARNQAGIHRGRWKTLAEDADTTMKTLDKRLQRAMKRWKL